MPKASDLEDFRARLKSSTNLWGPLMTSRDPTFTETILQASPDLIIADMEHSLIDVQHLQDMCMAAGHTPVLARMKGLEKNEIKKVLDTGVSGIIVPGIETAKDAEDVVAYSRFAPEGKRGAGPGRASGYGYGFGDYIRARPVIIVQIETKPAFENVEKIASIKGLDGLFIGPFDLSIALQIEYSWENSTFIAAIQRIKKAAVDHNLITGMYSPLSTDLMTRTASENFSFMMLGMDREAMTGAYANAGKTLKTLKK